MTVSLSPDCSPAQLCEDFAASRGGQDERGDQRKLVGLVCQDLSNSESAEAVQVLSRVSRPGVLPVESAGLQPSSVLATPPSLVSSAMNE